MDVHGVHVCPWWVDGVKALSQHEITPNVQAVHVSRKFLLPMLSYSPLSLTIRKTDVELKTRIGSARTTLISVNSLRRALTDLPVEAWSYGRIVALSRDTVSTPADRQAIDRNLRATISRPSASDPVAAVTSPAALAVPHRGPQAVGAHRSKTSVTLQYASPRFAEAKTQLGSDWRALGSPAFPLVLGEG